MTEPTEINRVMLDKPLELSVNDPLAIAKNVATNGRLFCVLLVLISLVLFVVERDANFAIVAVLSAIPVGASCVIDQMPNRPIRSALVAIVYLFTALIPLAILANIG